MRYKEFANAKEDLMLVKLTFDKALRELKSEFLKRIEREKNKRNIAKQHMKNRRLKSHRNDSNDGSISTERPKRS